MATGLDVRASYRSYVNGLCSVRTRPVPVTGVPALQNFFPRAPAQAATFHVCEARLNLPGRGPTIVHAGFFEVCNIVSTMAGGGCQDPQVQTEAMIFEVISVPDPRVLSRDSMTNSIRMWSGLSQMLIQETVYQGR